MIHKNSAERRQRNSNNVNENICIRGKDIIQKGIKYNSPCIFAHLCCEMKWVSCGFLIYCINLSFKQPCTYNKHILDEVLIAVMPALSKIYCLDKRLQNIGIVEICCEAPPFTIPPIQIEWLLASCCFLFYIFQAENDKHPWSRFFVGEGPGRGYHFKFV